MKRILVVDDENNIRDYLREELSVEGYEVIEANSAPAALKIIEKEDIDLVVLDIRMPGMTGVEALPRILGLKEHLPVILNTAYSQYQQDFMAWAANAYVIKSADLTELKEKIKDLLQEVSDRKPSEEKELG